MAINFFNAKKTFDKAFFDKASINNLEPEDLEAYKKGKGISLHTGAVTFSDAVITGSSKMSKTTAKILEETDKPVLEYKSEEEYLAAYLEFFNSLLEQEVE